MPLKDTLRECRLGECGGKTVTDNGNGALMRILPLAFVDHGYDDICAVAGLTHGHYITHATCLLYLVIADKIIKEIPIGEILADIHFESWRESIGLRDIRKLNRDEIKSTGYVVDTLEAALWCLYNTDNYRDCVIAAVNLGDDTDTVAAVAGGLAGLIYGCGGKKGIPKEWISKIARKEWIEDLCECFEHAIPVKDFCERIL